MWLYQQMKTKPKIVIYDEPGPSFWVSKLVPALGSACCCLVVESNVF